MRRIGVAVIADFWSWLVAFVSLRRPPRRWALVLNKHPFLASNDAGGVSYLVGPAAHSPVATGLALADQLGDLQEVV